MGGVAAAMGANAAPKQKPNFLFIFSDDQTYEALRALGNDEIKTPNLDRLVARGVTFTHAYNMGAWHGAVCVASRTMLNTGRFLWRAQALDVRKKGAPKPLVGASERGEFWAQLLERGGYDTYMTGKWHVAVPPEKVFQRTASVRGGMPNQTPQGYNRPKDKADYDRPDAWKPWKEEYGGFWKGGKHWSEVVGDESEAFIKQAERKDKPFFMYLAFNAPHDPRQSPKRYVDMYPVDKVKVPEDFQPLYPHKDKIGCGRGLRDEKLAPFPRTEYAVKVNRQEYYAIVTHMDEQVGRILDALEASGKADNTYIFFTSDHGLACGHHGLIGKQNMYEHSMRVPLMVAGPGVQAGKKLNGAVYLQDIMATTLELAGVKTPDYVEFKSLMPMIRGERSRNYDEVYGAYTRDLQRMIIAEGHKLILYPKVPVARLYNLKDDPQEMNDLAGKPGSKPLMKRLFARFLKLQQSMGDPLDVKAAFPELS